MCAGILYQAGNLIAITEFVINVKVSSTCTSEIDMRASPNGLERPLLFCAP